MLNGYIRIWLSGPSEDDQRAALIEAGVDPDRIWTDKMKRRVEGVEQLPSRAEILRSGTTRKDTNDEVVIHSPAILGPDTTSITEAMTGLAKLEVGLRVLSIDRVFSWTRENVPGLEYLNMASEGLRQAQTSKARSASEGKGGRKAALSPSQKTEVRKLHGLGGWPYSRLAVEFKVSVPTIQRAMKDGRNSDA